MKKGLVKEIADIIKVRIFNGSYLPGEKLPSIRLLARQEHHNPGTVHHALYLLEQQGFIAVRRTAGYFVIDDPEQIDKLQQQESNRLIRQICYILQRLGFSGAEICSLFQQFCSDSPPLHSHRF